MEKNNRQHLKDKLKSTMIMTGGNTDAEKDFYERGAEFGYSLAEEEIKRLNLLIRKAFEAGEKRKAFIVFGQGKPPVPPNLEEFKEKNNL
jgi:hypothetical protein